MLFTKENFLSIEKYLLANAKKDTQFPLANEVRSNDYLPIILDNENKRIAFKDFKGISGESAYDIAVRKGYVGTEDEWLNSIKGSKIKVGLIPSSSTSAGGYTFTVIDYSNGKSVELSYNIFNGVDGKNGINGINGKNASISATRKTNLLDTGKSGVLLEIYSFKNNLELILEVPIFDGESTQSQMVVYFDGITENTSGMIKDYANEGEIYYSSVTNSFYIAEKNSDGDIVMRDYPVVDNTICIYNNDGKFIPYIFNNTLLPLSVTEDTQSVYTDTEALELIEKWFELPLPLTDPRQPIVESYLVKPSDIKVLSHKGNIATLLVTAYTLSSHVDNDLKSLWRLYLGEDFIQPLQEFVETVDGETHYVVHFTITVNINASECSPKYSIKALPKSEATSL